LAIADLAARTHWLTLCLGGLSVKGFGFRVENPEVFNWRYPQEHSIGGDHRIDYSVAVQI
jgi:hypothetical protein